ncbi:MAG: (deoxy)nucleoside triphosphate pyrophosphohydrolase [Bdellovibrionales bacterium]|nr:(deoxy)nucleoside triphosphate pyrophosphohydrolase [Bdellovibrionales bacterium]
MTKKKRPVWVPVVTGLIIKNSKVLIGCRPQDKNLSGKWEFPGGKIELSESPEQALKRELLEELGIDAEIGPLKLVGTHAYGDTGILILFYEIKYWKGEPKTLYHTELKWVEFNELKLHPLPEANEKMLSRILAVLND